MSDSSFILLEQESHLTQTLTITATPSDRQDPTTEESDRQDPATEGSDRETVKKSENDEGIGEKNGEEEEEEEGECGFCLFMKGGGCKESFTAWEKCVDEAEKEKEDIVEKCAEVTSMLKKCMEAHTDYYEPILRAEKNAEQQALNELEKVKENDRLVKKDSEQQIEVLVEQKND